MVMGMSALISLHALAAVVWVGGMFFAYMVLRPSAGPLPPPERLRLWRDVFGLFFLWVWASIAVLLGSGYGLIFAHYGGFAGAGLHIDVMQATGLAMMALFVYVYFFPWRRFREAVAAEAFAAAAEDLHRIRRVVAINLVLGIVTVIAGAGGRFW